MYGFNVDPQQYRAAYPSIPYEQPPNASNGYGWHGNGYGWQVDPSVWYNPKPEGSEEVKEPELKEQKVEHQESGLGERGSGFRSKGDVQDFYQLRDELLENGQLFEDPEFPTIDSSIFYSQRVGRGFEWRRPHEICDNPQLFVEGYSRFDVQQGELGDCWLLAAVANLTLYRRLFFQVVPDDQGFDEKYAGIFHFRFWQYGRWIDVVIDDRLPTYNGQLVFLHSTEESEFWSALLEKAYAKLHGSYEALKGGSTCEAMEDFTGGVTEMYEMNASPPNLFKIVMKAYERSSLMGCSLEPDPSVLEAETREGLVRGHAYSITRVKYVDIQTPNTSGKIPLVRLRNPWGNECEWNGAWSDKSPEWRFIPEHEKEELGLTFDDDGEFWMSFKDFQTHFDRLEICNLNPDSLTEQELQEGHKKRWEVSFFEGEWVRGVTAGGCRNYLDTFWHNPQYRITLTEVDEEDEEGKCTLIVALMQKNRRSQRNMGIDILTIGFAIYYLPDPDRAPKPLDLSFFKYNSSVARSPSFINLREVSCRFKLPPGTYCIVPTTFEPNEEGEYLLRIFSEHQNNLEYVHSSPKNKSVTYFGGSYDQIGGNYDKPRSNSNKHWFSDDISGRYPYNYTQAKSNVASSQSSLPYPTSSDASAPPYPPQSNVNDLPYPTTSGNAPPLPYPSASPNSNPLAYPTSAYPNQYPNPYPNPYPSQYPTPNPYPPQYPTQYPYPNNRNPPYNSGSNYNYPGSGGGYPYN